MRTKRISISSVRGERCHEPITDRREERGDSEDREKQVFLCTGQLISEVNEEVIKPVKSDKHKTVKDIGEIK
jgi:hypothetical protein